MWILNAFLLYRKIYLPTWHPSSPEEMLEFNSQVKSLNLLVLGIHEFEFHQVINALSKCVLGIF